MNFISYVEKIKDILYRVIYIIMICGSILFLGNYYIGIEEISIKHLIKALLFILVVFLFCCSHVKGRMIISCVAIIAFIMQGLLIGFDELGIIFLGYFNWVAGTGFEEKYVQVYYSVQIFWVVCFCFVVTYILEKSKLVRTILFIAAIVLTGYLIGAGINVSKAGVMFLLTYIVISFSELIENYWKKQRVSQSRHLYLIWLWPAWILVLFITFISPSSPEPFRWEFVRSVISTIDVKFTTLTQWVRARGTEDFDIRMAGFSTDARLLGDTVDNSKVVFNIKSEKTMMSNLYLLGITYQDFNGREWTNPENQIDFDQRMDATETVYRIYTGDRDNQSHFIQRNRLFFEYQYFTTRYYFTPQKITFFNIQTGKSYFEDKDQRAAKKIFGDEYSTSFLEMNPTATKELLLMDYEKNEKLLKEAANDCRVGSLGFEGLEKYREDIKATYSKSVELSQDMKDWVNEITKDCDTDYDKLKNIEVALNGFDYTLSPGLLPENIDNESEYLDYFILEKKSGYCTYFASAFTLLARSLGLPARYVQGFCVPMIGKNSMQVTGRMAHAWSEVYFEGAGWVIFEATPGYSEIRYTKWVDPTREKIDYSSIYDYYMKMTKEASVKPEEEVAPVTNNVDIVKRLGIFLLGVVLIAISVGIILLIDYLIKREKYKRLDNYNKLKWQMNSIFKLLKKFDITKEDYETLGELNIKIKEKYEEWGLEKPVIIENYELVLYGGREADEEMINEAIESRKLLINKKRVQHE